MSTKREISLEEKRVFQRELYEKCQQYLGEDGEHCLFDVSSNSKEYDVGFVYCDYMAREAGKEEEEYFDAFLKALNAESDIQVLMFVGSKVESIAELSESYRTAMILKSLLVFHSDSRISYYEDMQMNSSGNILCKGSMDALVRAVEQNDQEDIEQCVDIIFDELERGGMRKDLLEININYLLFQLLHLAVTQNNQISQEDILKYLGMEAFDLSLIHI